MGKTVSARDRRQQRKDRTLSREEKAALRALEKTLRDRMHDFVEVGRVLDLINRDNLYRVISDSFGEYCEQEWGIARRTAYLKIKTSAVYRQIQHAAHTAGIPLKQLPKNEHIVRQLQCLDAAVSPWQAWQKAIALSTEQKCPITAALVQQVVDTVNTQRAKEEVSLSLIQDDPFPGIPFRLDVYAKPTGEAPPTLLLDLPRLLNAFTSQSVADTRSDSPGGQPLVMVSMHDDLLAETSSFDERIKLIQLLGCIPEYRFLIWTTNYTGFDQLSVYPENIEWVARVRSQRDVAAFETFWRHQERRRDCGLWVEPWNRAIDFPRVAFSRVLFGLPISMRTQPYPNLSIFRHPIAQVLSLRTPLHLSASICEGLTEIYVM